MHPRLLTPLLLSTLIFAACGTTPNTNLESARMEVQQAESNPLVTTNASQELEAAKQSLQVAENAWKDDKDESEVNHLAYLARQSAMVATERARQKEAEKQIDASTAERDRVRLEARTTEADRAKMQAAQAQQQAKDATAQAQNANAQAQDAKAQARDAQALAAQAQASNMDAQARNAQLEAELKALNAKSTDRGMVVTLGDVLFDSGKARLKPGSRRNIQQLAAALKNTGGRKIVIEGHTDSKGGDDLNQQLSEDRADSVKDALLELGVDQAQIKTEGYGEKYPVANNKSASGRQLNRRVEIIIAKDDKDVTPRSQ